MCFREVNNRLLTKNLALIGYNFILPQFFVELKTGDLSLIIFFDVNQTSKSYARQYLIPFHLHNSWPYTVVGLGQVAVDSQVNVVVGQNYFYNTFYFTGNGGMQDEEFSVSEWIGNNVGIVERLLQTGGTSGIDYFIKWSLIRYHLK